MQADPSPFPQVKKNDQQDRDPAQTVEAVKLSSCLQARVSRRFRPSGIDGLFPRLKPGFVLLGAAVSR